MANEFSPILIHLKHLKYTNEGQNRALEEENKEGVAMLH